MFGDGVIFPAETLSSFFFVVPFLRVTASLRELAFVIASWGSCFTAARRAAIGGAGVGRVRVR